ncbi:MAG: ABC transporter ATP-binding protein, partial [Chloroflexi bacterium]|nr:ABC transporter ATP-binding protein [Chloroflexota bacterium]
SGRLSVLGDDISTLTARELARRVAVVPQTLALPESFRALDCVLMGRTPHLSLLQNEGATDVEIAREAMMAMDVWRFAERAIGELSGGERQRVVIARALAQQTPVLLLDEPIAHLDIGHQAAVLEMARTLCKREGKAILAIVHDLTVAAQYCDRLIMLNRGQIVREGHPSDVLREDVLAEVYGTHAIVFPHPQTGLPVVAPSPQDR